jgi:AcrR family transcriptional regulator
VYEGTTMQDVAKTVGLKKQSIYSHFNSKEELYLTILKEQKKLIMSEIFIIYGHIKEKPAEELLKAMFKSIVEIFANRERLLLWKRSFITFGSDDNIFNRDVMEWQFEKELKDVLFLALSKTYPALSDNEMFQPFYISYVLMIHGYLDWMIVKGYDKTSWKSVWFNFWNGIENYFMI